MTKKLNIQTDELSSEEEDFLSFADEQPVENAGWLRRAVGSGAHVIAEVTGISNILKSPKPLSAEEEDDDNYTPFIEDTNALKYIPTYDATPTQKKIPVPLSLEMSKPGTPISTTLRKISIRRPKMS